MSRTHQEGQRYYGKGKVVDTWYYAVKDVATIKRTDDEADRGRSAVIDRKIEIKLVAEKITEGSDAPPHPLQEIRLAIDCDNPKFRIEGTDIEAMRRAAWEKLDVHFAVTWEDYYLVKVSKPRFYGGETGGGLEVSYDEVEKGTTYDGKLLLREDRWTNREKIKPWPGEFKDENGHILACIPATEENKAAMDEFIRRLDEVRKRLAEFLRPDKIMETFAALNMTKALPWLGEPVPDPPSQEARFKKAKKV